MSVKIQAADIFNCQGTEQEIVMKIEKLEILETDYETHNDIILVVDDDRMNLLMAKRMLQNKYKVVCVSSGYEALRFLRETVPDLILLDLHMPEMNGLEIFDQIKNMEALREVPVMFLTADCERETELSIFMAGATDYVQKPFIAEVVIQRIARILELRHYQKSLQKEVDRKTEKLKQSNKKIKNLMSQIISTLANAIEVKDQYTRGHSVRVAQYSREIARRMGKNEEAADSIYYIALLHDIGKIGISDDIINKSGRLTDEEYNVIKQHPVLGADILKDITELPDAAVGARWHHEKFDGTGYPDGLRGNEIPEAARIIGVADAYDAMSSKRSYRDALPQQTIREEIIKDTGTQFDPAIAGIMLAMMDEDTKYDMKEHM